MNPIMEFLTGMNTLTDQVIAMDFLNSAKSGVRNYAFAITEAGTPEVKEVLLRQLEEAIDTHDRILAFMLEKQWYQPWDIKGQFQLDLQNIDLSLKAPTL
ncbi:MULTISPECIES: spore coat protein [unclassified Paenibacillus]|uniref:spore coat protein n=1 Tax=unclassified Paenibacillus TaxID=185978 RepID=UPI001042EADC|nr:MULTISPECIES: spore coat protein [unclassified Paenibacillus]NIK71729.1 hypothetical protein [Paenibacillus sp. BK720]TCM96377.1 hypothetical protein EV294_105244 [Paenibacillus sp. BK033]